jgi:hypothetical protein
MKLEKELVNAIQQANKKTTSAYDTLATVTRIEGATAWVHVDGGVEETPVEMTIACKKGDKVRVRFSGGYAYTIGNSTAPPTDDYVANIANNTAVFAKTTAVDAKGTADRVDRTTKPAYVNYTTYYKLAEIEPLQPSDDTWEEEGWSTEQPIWSEDDDRMMWYSIRVQKVSGAIEWSVPHELTAYANIQILRNAIISEVGARFASEAIQDSDGEDILDSNNKPIYSTIANIIPIYSRITQTAEMILSEVVKIGDSGIDEMSSAMLQNSYGVNIYNDIDTVGDTYAHIDGDSFDIKEITSASRIDDANDPVLASFNATETFIGKGQNSYQISLNPSTGIKLWYKGQTSQYNGGWSINTNGIEHIGGGGEGSQTKYSFLEMSMNNGIYGSSQITPGYARFFTYDSSSVGETVIEGGSVECLEVVSPSIHTPEGIEVGDRYTTAEKIVGFFTDSKPIYQKTIGFGLLPDNDLKGFPHSIANIDKIWIYDGFVEGTVISAVGTFPLQLGISDRTGGATWAFYANRTYILCDSHGDATAYTASVTIRYTKTTD